jgi:fusion and transport protein UGO1
MKKTIPKVETIVDVGAYYGVFGTMWHIVHHETSRPQPIEGKAVMRGKVAAGTAANTKDERRGQGLEGLYRGWRVGMWGLVGMWGASALGGVSKGGEF